MLDRMVCADCVSEASQGQKTISHLMISSVDASYFPKKTQSNSNGEQSHKSFCSICANVLMSTEVFSSNIQIIVANYNKLQEASAVSELHYSIDKPPQNFLV
jgi:hypothetical protein